MRVSKISFPKVALFCGAGAVRNAWTPVVKALNKFTNGPVTPSSANSAFAHLVHMKRFSSYVAEAPQKAQLDSHYIQLKNEIALELKNSEKRNEITAREELEVILKTFVLPYSSLFTLISTNWDRVVDSEVERILNNYGNWKVSALHLHGNLDDADSLYLPSESTIEPYRTETEKKEKLSFYYAVVERLASVERLIIYGLSLSPLDAELTNCIYEAVSTKLLKEIYIVNPDHTQVAEILKSILHDPHSVKIYGIDPNRLREI
jgi:hypothetical protein